MSKNLWGELPDFEKQIAPRDILLEQADQLGKVTNGILRAEVRQVPAGLTHPKEIGMRGKLVVGGKVEHFPLARIVDDLAFNFVIVAPRLRGYEYELLKIIHGPSLYPVAILDFTNSVASDADSPEVVEKILAGIFQSKNVQEVLRSLIVQSK